MQTPPHVERTITPDIAYIPEHTLTRAGEIDAVLDELGLAHQPWHDQLLRRTMAIHPQTTWPDERWLCPEVGIVVPCGPELRYLAFLRAIVGAALLLEPVLFVSPSLNESRDTAGEFIKLVEQTPVLHNLVSKIRRANGEEGVEFQGGGKVMFRTLHRSRGYSSCRLVIAHLVHALQDSFLDYVAPMLVNIPDHQVWYLDVAPSAGLMRLVAGRARVSVEQTAMYLEWAT